MPYSIILSIPISKSLFLVNKAIEETIALFVETDQINKVACSNNPGVYAIELNSDEVFSNMRDVLVIVQAKPERNGSTSSLVMVLVYSLANQAVRQKLFNAIFGKPLLRNKVLHHLLDFKQRIEKWS